VAVALVRSDAESRFRDITLLFLLVGWLAYTRVFWVLSAGHMTLPACPFFLITGHPCPFCGGTRSFASMWQADVVKAARFHPLGPVLFAGTVVAVGLLASGVASGRSWQLRLGRDVRKTGVALIVAAFVVSWTLKLFWLGN
jgi:hypothetical protein